MTVQKRNNESEQENSFSDKSCITAVRRVTILGIIFNLIFSIVKFVVGVLGHSQAVIADGIHSLSDLITDFSVLIGVKYWVKAPDESHPYGHRKIESLITFIIGIILGFVGIELMINAIQTAFTPQLHSISMIAIVGPALSIIGKEFLYRITIKEGRRIKSSALIANAWHHRSDALSSIPTLIAVLVSSFFPALFFVDSIGAGIVSLFIFKVAFDIVKPAVYELTDKSADKDLLESISSKVVAKPDIYGIHKIRSRVTNGMVLLDLHIQVKGNLSVKEGHEIGGRVKREILEMDKRIMDVLIHIEPYDDSK